MESDPNGKTFPKLRNDCILKAALGMKTDYAPVWIMRQAGRYLPEFRELRKAHSFFDICENPELASKVTLMPIERFGLDAAIIFSDILVIPQALGMQVDMTKDGPKFPDPLSLGEPISDRLIRDVEISRRLRYSYQAITITRHALDGRCPLIGFSGAPWTLMCYMIEGGGSKTMSKAKKWLYKTPEASHELLSLLAEKVTDHLVEQARAGAQLLQLFESNAEYLNRDLFTRFAYPYITRICSNVKERLKELKVEKLPIVVFAKGGHFVLDKLSKDDQPYDVIGLDWTMDPESVRNMTNKCLQGNLDPCAMYSKPAEVREMVKKMLKSFGTQNYIANLGHGIYPDAEIECVRAFVDSVHELSMKINSGADID